MQPMRKTKIVCTLGPASEDEATMRQMIESGMDVARFNFSHGTHASHQASFDRLRSLREAMSRPIAALMDTKGPEIRIGRIEGGPLHLDAGQEFTLTAQPIVGDATRASVSYAGLPADLTVGAMVLIDDGLIEMEVTAITGGEIRCRVLNGGMISDNKGVNVPGTALTMPYISPRDREDILFAIECGFDFIAASFVRGAEDIAAIRQIMDERHCQSINIIAKIENLQGVENIDEIIRVSDGIMVARGDMGVEIPMEDVPAIQKMIIKKVYNAGKQVITATQMLDSMIHNPRPTRAEATDVANAIYDGTSAIMLSGETAAGKYPVEALQTMARIALRTEADIDYAKRSREQTQMLCVDVTSAISHATCTTALDIGAAAILTVTKSGATARMISKYRPVSPIIGCATTERVCRQINMSWGVIPLLLEEQTTTDELFNKAVDTAQRHGLVEPGEMVVITAGIPLGISGTTNIMKVHVVGYILVSGEGVGSRSVSAPVDVFTSAEAALAHFTPGHILAIPETDNSLLPIMKKAAGIVTELPGINSHAAIVGLSLDIPVITGAANATHILRSGAAVLLDADRGVVSVSDQAPPACQA